MREPVRKSHNHGQGNAGMHGFAKISKKIKQNSLKATLQAHRLQELFIPQLDVGETNKSPLTLLKLTLWESNYR